MTFIFCSFFGIMLVSLLTLIGTGVASVVNLLRGAIRKPPIVDKSNLVQIGGAALLVLVIELILIFVVF